MVRGAGVKVVDGRNLQRADFRHVGACVGAMKRVFLSTSLLERQ